MHGDTNDKITHKSKTISTSKKIFRIICKQNLHIICNSMANEEGISV